MSNIITALQQLDNALHHQITTSPTPQAAVIPYNEYACGQPLTYYPARDEFTDQFTQQIQHWSELYNNILFTIEPPITETFDYNKPLDFYSSLSQFENVSFCIHNPLPFRTKQTIPYLSAQQTSIDENTQKLYTRLFWGESQLGDDDYLMRPAIQAALLSDDKKKPIVGAALFEDNILIESSSKIYNGLKKTGAYKEKFIHAERALFYKLATQNREINTQYSTLAITIEPCIPSPLALEGIQPCATMIIDKRIPRVVFGQFDALTCISGRSVEYLRSHNIDCRLAHVTKPILLELKRLKGTMHMSPEQTNTSRHQTKQEKQGSKPRRQFARKQRRIW